MKRYQHYTIEQSGYFLVLKYKNIKLFSAKNEQEAIDMVNHHIENTRRIAGVIVTLEDFK